MALCRRRCGLIGPVKPLPYVGIGGTHHFVDLFFCLFFGHPVTLLKQPNELLASSSRALQIVVSQITPLFTHLTFNLFPFSRCLICVHGVGPQVEDFYYDCVSPRLFDSERCIRFASRSQSLTGTALSMLRGLP
jgi:hypothetical protein